MLGLFRHRRTRVRLSWLALAALLWSQALVSLHVDCLLPAAQAQAPAATPASQHEDCAGTEQAAARSVCQAHCDQGDRSAEGARAAPSVPMLEPVPALALEVLAAAATREAPALPRHFAGAWHRPTPHPASILLI